MTVSLAAEVRGDPAHPTVVFLHGFMGATDDWRPVMEALADAYYCVALDLPGHGQTPASDDEAAYSFAGALAAVALRVDELGVKQAHWVGYSMGGRLALAGAFQYPERLQSLVLLSSSPGLLEPRQAAARVRHDETWAKRLLQPPLEDALTAWYGQPLFASLHDYPSAYNAMIARRLRNRPPELARSMLGMSVGRQTPLWEKLSALIVPTLVLAGEKDPKYCEIAARMAAASDRIQARHVPAAGHSAHIEQPAEVGALLRNWIDTHK